MGQMGWEDPSKVVAEAGVSNKAVASDFPNSVETAGRSKKRFSGTSDAQNKPTSTP